MLHYHNVTVCYLYQYIHIEIADTQILISSSRDIFIHMLMPRYGSNMPLPRARPLMRVTLEMFQHISSETIHQDLSYFGGRNVETKSTF